MAKRTFERRLLVEGRDEQRLIPELIEQNGIEWGDKREEAVVDIEEFDGIANLLKPGVIEAELKASGVRCVGIMIDADEDIQARWDSVRQRCIQAFPNIPKKIPKDGLVVENETGLRLGVWIMPDNHNSGMLETFLTYLVPNSSDSIYLHAQDSATKAKDLGAEFIDKHWDKAYIHTWLAWQNPPGRQLHQSIIERILIANSPHSKPFVDWFRKLYEL